MTTILPKVRKAQTPPTRITTAPPEADPRRPEDPTRRALNHRRAIAAPEVGQRAAVGAAAAAGVPLAGKAVVRRGVRRGVRRDRGAGVRMEATRAAVLREVPPRVTPEARAQPATKAAVPRDLLNLPPATEVGVPEVTEAGAEAPDRPVVIKAEAEVVVRRVTEVGAPNLPRVTGAEAPSRLLAIGAEALDPPRGVTGAEARNRPEATKVEAGAVAQSHQLATEAEVPPVPKTEKPKATTGKRTIPTLRVSTTTTTSKRREREKPKPSTRTYSAAIARATMNRLKTE